MHVLIADSEPGVAADAARALRKNGMTVDIAMNARVASALWASTEYDVVVVEQDLRQDLRPHPRSQGHRTAVLVTTAPGSPVGTGSTPLVPSDGHLSKPFDLDDLVACVREVAAG